ncbi:MAG: S9 family peptidase [Armatimonadetes bacterium]|nr:S9 family peptidase [Armatimonadota bacterium]
MRVFVAVAFLPAVVFGQQFTWGLGIPVPGNARTPIRIDPVEYALLTGHTAPFVEGEQIGANKWTTVVPNKEGNYSGGIFNGGYAQFTIESATEQVKFLEASGHNMVYVNGEPRVGDPYSYGYVSLPVLLKKGTNTFLFSVGRGSLKANLVDVAKPVSFDLRDTTLPDAKKGTNESSWASVMVRNSTAETLTGLTIEGVSSVGPCFAKLGNISPFSVRKSQFVVPLGGDGRIELTLKKGTQTLDTTEVQLGVKKPLETHKVTFRSKIDGSIQYYGVNPSQKPDTGQALFLSLHGASVEGIGQAQAYGPKDWGTLVAATNRRPYGFDWEEVGRLDALEVLSDAKERFKPDPQKVYLTGHSMGGHGTWQIGAHYPDKFAAIAPSAGWISFWTYAGGAKYPNPSPVEQMLLRAMSPSDTLALKQNFAQQGIFVLHGDADDNVPVSEARTMRKELEPFHKDLHWFEQPGAGHWWDADPAPGADAVDYKGIFDLFKDRKIPLDSQVSDLQFATSSPSVSAKCHWATIEQQVIPYTRSSLDLHRSKGSITGTTDNVARMTLTLSEPMTLTLDGNELSAKKGQVFLEKVISGWKINSKPTPASQKNPVRGGTIKSIFDHGVVFVYGTRGKDAQWAQNAARFQAEQFWYRGNSSVEIYNDKEFLSKDLKDHNVVLFGGIGTNAVADKWKGQVPTPPGDAVMMIRPRPDSNIASFVLLSGPMTDRMPFFSSGASMPDYMVLSKETLLKGTKAVVAAGFFTNDWKVSVAPEFMARSK